MNFEHPWILYFLLPVAVIFFLIIRRSSRQERQRLPLLAAGVLVLFVSLANPYWSYTRQERIYKGVDLILILDVSQSMFCAVDGKGTRIDQARTLLRNLLPQFAGSNVSIVYFAGDAQLGSPYTGDLQAAYLFLDSVMPRMTTQPGTRAQSLPKVLEELAGQKRNVISGRKPLALLFSDGEFFDSTQFFTSWIRRNNLRVYSFLCGAGKSPVPKYDLSGLQAGAESEVKIQPLQAIAGATGGTTYQLGKTPAQLITNDILSKVAETIEKGEPAPDYRYRPFLFVAALFVVLYQLIPLYRSIHLRDSRVAVALSILILVTTVSMTSDQQKKSFQSAIRDTKEKRYDQALKKLQALRKENPATEVETAIGNVHFEMNNIAKAIEHYRKAVDRNPWDQVARWNWEVALKRQTSPDQPAPDRGPAPPPPVPQSPEPTDALLKYSDQLEKQQMQRSNPQHPSNAEFAW